MQTGLVSAEIRAVCVGLGHVCVQTEVKCEQTRLIFAQLSLVSEQTSPSYEQTESISGPTRRNFAPLLGKPGATQAGLAESAFDLGGIRGER